MCRYDISHEYTYNALISILRLCNEVSRVKLPLEIRVYLNGYLESVEYLYYLEDNK